MFIPWLSKRRSLSTADRLRDKSIVWICVFGLLCVLGAGHTVAETTYDPRISLTKTVDDVHANGDGTFSALVTLVVKNIGNEKLVALQVNDHLDFVESERIVEVSLPQVLSGQLTVNPDYDGLNDYQLLQGDDILLPGSEAAVRFSVRFSPGDGPGPFTNEADAWSRGKFSGIGADDWASFTFSLPLEPIAEFEKTASEVTRNGDGTFAVQITLEASNVGPEDLVRIQIKDNLDIFGAGQLIGVSDFGVLAGELTLNPDYDGRSDIRLLSGYDTIPVGESASLRFTVTFAPGTEPGPFRNCAMLWFGGRESGIGKDVTDCAHIRVPLEPQISLQKTAGPVGINSDDSLSVPITLIVTNLGNEALNSLQIEDSLDIFGSGQLIAVENLASTTLSINPNYDGLTDINVLTGSDVLPLTTSASVTFVVRFDPGDEPGPFLNTATASAAGETSGDPVSDSDDAPFLTVPTEQQAAISVDKTAGEVVDNGDDTLSVPITITVTNVGNEALSTVQLEDSLDIFGSGQLIAVESLASTTLSINPNYDGLTDINLLTGSDVLPLATSATVSFVVRFDPGAETQPFVNVVEATASSVGSGDPVSDSDDAAFLAIPTEQQPAISVDKTAGEVVDNGDDTLSVPITITVTNVGNEALTALQLEDSLDIFGSGQLIAVEDLASATLNVNPNYDGLTDINLLSGSDILPLATSAIVIFVVRFDPGPEPGPFVNTAIASATGESSGDPVSDSDDAPFLATPTVQQPAIDVEKTVGEDIDNGDGTQSIPITITVTNIGNEALAALQLEDNLNIFGSGQLIAVEDLASATLSINPNYDGLIDIDLLTGTDLLPPATSATVTFVLRFDPGPEPGPFLNTATANATGETSGDPVSNSDDASFERIGTLPLSPAGIFVTKAADRSDIVRGDLVGYEVSVTNLTVDPVVEVVIADEPPPGFRFVADSAFLIRAGTDELLKTADDVISPLPASGTNPVEFEAFDLSPDESVLVRYLMRVSVGVADGVYINNVVVTPLQREPEDASAPVTVVGDPIFEKTTLIGKVFDDQNKNGRQDNDEQGVPGVRLATVTGLTIETDAKGRYHLADVDVDRFERGANFIIKLDKASLPERAEVISENPRVVRLTQATMSKVNFAVKLQVSDPANCVESCLVEENRVVHQNVSPELCVAEPAYDDNWLNGPLSTSVVDPSRTNCARHMGPVPQVDTAEARQIEVSGGLFGCSRLVARTLPGRAAAEDSQVTVFASRNVGSFENLPPCYVSDKDGVTIKPGEPPIEITTMQGTRIRITGTGDVIRIDDPENDEHIVVTPFRDDTDNAVISALRVVNDGMDPSAEAAAPTQLMATTNAIKSANADVLATDPRLDVLALNRALVDSNGDLFEPIRFGVYTNYSAFIQGYRLEIYGSSKDGFAKKLLHKDEFSEYRFDQQREFAGKGLNLLQYVELEYLLKASDCPTPFDEQQCVVDVTNVRILTLRDEQQCDVDVTNVRILTLRDETGVCSVHHENELWGQTSLAVQRIPVRGGRIRISDKSTTEKSHVLVNGSYVPVGKNSTYVLEEHLPPGNYDFSLGQGRRFFRQAGDVISADAHEINVSGGLFGCGKVKVFGLLGRNRNNGETIHSATVTAKLDARSQEEELCPSQQSVCNHRTEVNPGEIVITSKEGSCLRVTSSGDVISEQHPPDHENRQQLVVTPFRDYTDSTKVSALRIVNEGFPSESRPDNSSPATTVSFGDDYWFTVALASLTIGQNNVSGNLLPLSVDKHFDGSTFVDGRLAIYTKGKIDNKYLITAQLDSTEDELRDLGDNLRRKDPRRIFRQLDPNRHYPIYGDDSTTTTDVDTQGAFYARVDWDKNTALWGNFNTGLTDTEFMQYNRSLYGAKFAHENLQTTEFGSAKTKVTVFGSEAQSVAAHVTFSATGGSLYYLRDTDIVQGSEKVWVEVRRRDTEQVVERAVLIEGRDYEIDAIQGRMILRRPLSQVVNDRERSIVRSSPLEGDQVFLLVDYEFVPASFVADDVTYGGRGQAWLGDHVAIGATAVKDERSGSDYTLQGADLTLQLSEGSYLRAEYAQSRARQNSANFTSSDGGLTFQSQTAGGPGDSLDGDATAIELHADLSDFGEMLEGDLRAWWKSRDAEFSTGRLGQGVAVNDSGIEMHAKMGDDVELTASYTDLEREQLSRERVTRVQIEGELGDFDAGLEIRHEDVEIQAPALGAPISGLNGAASDGEALLIGARLGYNLNDETSVYATGQTVADDKGVYQENDLFTVGVNTKLNEGLAISLEASDGDRGSALTAGIDYATESGLNFNVSGGVGSGAISQFATRYAIGEGHELYGSYVVDPDRTQEARNLLTLGQRRTFGNGIDVFAESQFGKNDRYASVGHVFGLEFEGDDDWRFNASMQFSENVGLGLAFERRALSFGAYRNQGDLKLSSRIEYREDEGIGVHNRQYVSSSSFTRIIDDNKRWLGQLNVSWTDDELNGGHDARFVELDIGHAYRPAANDKFDLIARYSYLFDLPTEGQATIRPDERSHLLSIEGIYDPQNRWEFAAKAAVRKGERRILRDTGPWFDFGLRLASVRARYQVTKKWDALAEYRWLSDIDGNNDRHGALLALYRQVNDHFKVGVGFNFTDFNDRLRIDSYDSRGWFVDFIGAY